MNADRAIAARKLGQSLWYDNISRMLLRSGELRELVSSGIITGITTNPTIFHKAIESSEAYDSAIRGLLDRGLAPLEIYNELTLDDVAEAADLLRPVHDSSEGADGHISLEVRPSLANDADGTVEEGRALFTRLHRPNVMIKVPGTAAGVVAFQRLTEAGVNVNVTLLFSARQYEAIARSYVAALRARERRKEPVRTLASVASFFVSRVDTVVDAELERIAKGREDSRATVARSLLGKTGVANCKVAYRRFQELFGADFDDLRKAGARPQRMLWASTGTKNPQYSDVMYVDPLLGPSTVNTMPPATLKAFLDHGNTAASTVAREVDVAQASLESLKSLGIDLDRVCAKLQEDGVTLFQSSFDALIGALSKKALVKG